MNWPAVFAGSIWKRGDMAADVCGVGPAARIAANADARARPGATGFRVGGGIAGAGTVLGTDPVPCGVLLGLQEGEGDAVRDRAAKARARAMMAQLAMLQRDVLREGGVSREALVGFRGGGEFVTQPGRR